MHGAPGDAHLHSEVSLELRLEAGASQSCAGVRVGVVVAAAQPEPLAASLASRSPTFQCL